MTSYTASVGRRFSISTTWQSAGPLDLPHNIFPRARSTRLIVICMLRHCKAITLSPLHLCSLIISAWTSSVSDLLIGAFFAMCSHLLNPFVSVLSGPSTDPKLRHHALLDNLASGQSTHFWRQALYELSVPYSLEFSFSLGFCILPPKPPFP